MTLLLATRRRRIHVPPSLPDPEPPDPPEPGSDLRTLPPAPERPTVEQITTTLTPGSSAAQINSAIASAAPGAVIALRGGQYNLTGNLSFEATGAAGNPVTVMSYPGERAVLDFAEAPGGSRIWMNGARWMVVRDLEVRNAKSHGFYLTGQDGKPDAADNKFVNLVIRNSQLTGWAVVKGSRNEIWHSLAIWTQTVSTPGDADGFGPGGQQGFSDQNGCYGCVAVNPPDDAFDTWQSYRTRLLCNYAIRAGEYGGDGNGYKLGRGLPPEGSWTHSVAGEWYLSRALVRGNLAIDCDQRGFDNNTGADSDVHHNTAINSGWREFDFHLPGGNPTPLPPGNINTNLVRNNAAYGPNSLHTATLALASGNVTGLGTTYLVSVTAPPTSAFDGLSGEEAFALLETGAYSSLGRLTPDAPVTAPDIGFGTDPGAFPRNP